MDSDERQAMIEDVAEQKRQIARRAEYEICRDRGHQHTGEVFTSYPPQYKCRWCGTMYAVRDINPPGQPGKRFLADQG